MDIQYGKPAESVKRFSRFKWATAGALLVLLLLAWFGGANRETEPATDTPGSAAAPSAPPSLAIDAASDGKLTVTGTVADEATRDQWMNAIRIGAQGTPVTDELRLARIPGAEHGASVWAALSRCCASESSPGCASTPTPCTLKGSVGSPSGKAEVEKIAQARLPTGYRLDSQLAVSALAAGSSGHLRRDTASPGAAVPGTASASGSSARPAASAPDSAGAGAVRGADPDPGARAGAKAPDAAAPGKAATRKPANCPRRIQTLAKPLYFKTDSAGISSADRARLERLGECLGRAKVRIVGHADPRHTEEYNLELSDRRARAVAEALAAGGAPSSRISVVAAGKTKPDAKGASRATLQRSRRVDIELK